MIHRQIHATHIDMKYIFLSLKNREFLVKSEGNPVVIEHMCSTFLDRTWIFGSKFKMKTIKSKRLREEGEGVVVNVYYTRWSTPRTV